jgi:uncharacterized protein with von Willebrand factor type A (vWA) domain
LCVATKETKFFVTKLNILKTTTSYNEAERFASYHFTGGTQFSPIYSNTSVILEKDVPIDTEMVVITGYESEVILRNPIA